MTWRNWSGELACAPLRIERPVSTAEVAAAIRRTAAAGQRVRPVGSGHSFTPLAVTDEVMVDVSALDALLHVDREQLRVRVQAGIRLGPLAEQLVRRGLAFENLGDIDVQTLAGAVATATHGTGAELGNLPSQVEALQLVDGAGEVHELTRRDGDRFLAARVGLGALGVVTEVTLRVLPAYTLRGEDRVEPLEDVLDGFHGRAGAHRHFEAYAFPYSDHALTRTNDVVDAPPRSRHPARAWVQDRLLTTHALEAVSRTGRRSPAAIPALNRLVSRLAGSPPRTDHAHRIFASPRDVRFTEMELAVPRAATIDLVREVLELIERERYPVNFPLEIRSVAGDDALLSTAHDRDSCYVAVHNFVGLPTDDYFAAVWELAQRHRPRPHWGKRHPATAVELAPRYPAWDRFAAVRADLDPEGRFANFHLDRVLGPVRTTSGDVTGRAPREV
jgi:L-gulono-1,4-lactone dehydrogenase